MTARKQPPARRRRAPEALDRWIAVGRYLERVAPEYFTSRLDAEELAAAALAQREGR